MNERLQNVLKSEIGLIVNKKPKHVSNHFMLSVTAETCVSIRVYCSFSSKNTRDERIYIYFIEKNTRTASLTFVRRFISELDVR